MTGFESFVGVNPWTALFTFCNMPVSYTHLDVYKRQLESLRDFRLSAERQPV